MPDDTYRQFDNVLKRLQNSFDPLSDSDLDSLERRIGFPFPSDYRELLRLHNGGVFKHDVHFDMPGSVPWISQPNLSEWLGVAPEDDDSGDLLASAECYSDRIGDHRLPIVESGAGVVCMELDGPSRGQILIWDCAAEVGEKDLHPVAANVREFVSMWRPTEEESQEEVLPVFRSLELGDD